ncbi:hypothetical protein GIB67_036684 [Kingdonia uniflora]|uniref:Nodulation signaling pathway 2-like protein n=1 Tax=Kingdonia uniflora TaxID=39325 RepID=A0A7J7LWH0_9MAGN|nr:hypothetical protein GIB67_036684 [Kingdonia uniflora]
MQSQPSWSFYNIVDMDIDMCDFEFSSSFTTTDDSSDVSSNPIFFSSFPDDVQFVYPLEQYSPYVEDLDAFGNDQFSGVELEDVYKWMEGSESGSPLEQHSIEGSENTFSLHQHSADDENERSLGSSNKYSETSPDVSSVVQPSIVFPNDDIEVDNQLSILHLLKAYGEAMENGVTELADVILRRIREKSSPIGTTVERLAYYLFQAMDKQGDYLKQESFKNYEAAFKAFYQIFPYGKFAHLTANMSILEAIPDDVETIHIIDLDIGDGIQWPPVIEAIGCRRSLRLTSISWNEGSFDSVPTQLRFEETKRRLQNYAQSCGVKLKVEEMSMEELVSEIAKTKKRGRGREWLAFNCATALPHLGSRCRSRKQVMEFLEVAKELINSTNGTMTLGDGTGLEERMRNLREFGSFFDGYLLHSHALLESVELQFPSHLNEARTAMESLFIAPYVSLNACFRSWEETKLGSSLESGLGLKGLRFSKENLLQAHEMVRGSQYEVKVEDENVAILNWRGTPLVRVSTWR